MDKPCFDDLVMVRSCASYKDTLDLLNISDVSYFRLVRGETNKLRQHEMVFHEADVDSIIFSILGSYKVPGWAVEFAGEIDPADQIEHVLLRIQPDYLSGFYQNKKKVPLGTYLCPGNIEDIVSFAFESNIPNLASSDREGVVDALREYFVVPEKTELILQSMRLTAVMVRGLRGNLRNSPISMLKAYDGFLQRVKGFPSIFDLTLENHIHPWDLQRVNYFKGNVAEEMIVHLLEQNIPGLSAASAPDAVVLFSRAFSEAQLGMCRYFYGIGLGKVMVRPPIVNSPIKVLQVYDSKLQSESRGSLFDVSSPVFFKPNRLNELKVVYNGTH